MREFDPTDRLHQPSEVPQGSDANKREERPGRVSFQPGVTGRPWPSRVLAQELWPQAGPVRTTKGNHPTPPLLTRVSPAHLCGFRSD